METSNLPEELCFEILLRLPVESVLRFKPVCKLWYSIIQSSAFTSQHSLHHQNSKYHNIIVFDYYKIGQQPKISLFRASENFQICHHLPIPLFEQNYSFISCNGLVFAHTTKYSKPNCDDYVWNPATNHFRSLPLPPTPPPLPLDHFPHITWGFGFNNKTRDCKIIKVYHSLSPTEKMEYQAHAIYSFSTNSWSTKTTTPSTPFFPYNLKPCYNNGVSFWLGAFGTPPVAKVVSFDFSTEEFGSVSLPIRIQSGHLSLLRGKLAFYGPTSFEQGNKWNCEIWTLNEFGVDDTWTKLFRVGAIQSEIMICGGFLNDTEFLLVGQTPKKRDSRYSLGLLDPVTQEIATTFPLQQRPHILSLFQYVIYKESLVSIGGSNCGFCKFDVN